MNIRRVFISAGEPSGDGVGARLVAELRRQDPGVHVFGTGGARMREAGIPIVSDTTDIGVVGVTEVVRTLPSVVAASRAIRRQLAGQAPDAAVLIGNDVFNVMLARWLRHRGVATVSYFPPQAWMWRSLAEPIARSFDAIATSFPEEHEVYRAAASSPTTVTFVGHYLADELRPATEADRCAARRDLGLPDRARIIALLPGSRQNEIASLGPILLDAARRLAALDRELRFVIAPSNAAAAGMMRSMAARVAPGLHVGVATDSRTAMRSADLLLAASGTACLESALLGTPMIVVYKVSPATNLVAKTAVRLGLIAEYVVGLPNLVLGRSVVPELLQERATGEALAEAAWKLLSSVEGLERIRIDLARIHQRLGRSNAVTDVAAIVFEQIGRRSHAVAAAHWSTAVPPVGVAERE